MRVNQKDKFECAICKKSFAVNKIISGALVRDSVSQVIRSEHQEWSTDVYICRNDLSHYGGKYVQILLESEKGELSILEEEVLKSIEDQQLITTDIDTDISTRKLTTCCHDNGNDWCKSRKFNLICSGSLK